MENGGFVRVLNIVFFVMRLTRLTTIIIKNQFSLNNGRRRCVGRLTVLFIYIIGVTGPYLEIGIEIILTGLLMTVSSTLSLRCKRNKIFCIKTKAAKETIILMINPRRFLTFSYDHISPITDFITTV